MVKIEFTDPNQRVQKLIEYFDLNLERNMDFDISVCFHGPDQNCEEEKNLKDLLDELIQNERGWDRISASCRRMIICDRELDLEKGLDIFNDSLEKLKDLLSLKDDWLKHPEISTSLIMEKFPTEAHEFIRYINTCGLVSYRSGNYSDALDFFSLAEYISLKSDPTFLYFGPDVVSNRIRTEFELSVQVLPKPTPADYVTTLEEQIIRYITLYKEAIEKATEDGKKHNFESIDKRFNLIYWHGMASLYHNLAEAYSNIKKLIDKPSNLLIFMLNDHAKNANQISLKFGEKIGDIYRQLQSKNALRDLDLINKDKYEKEILEGGWVRGKVIICQDKIKNLSGSTDDDKEEVMKKLNDWTEKPYFTLDIMGNDKIGLLYNYDSIKKFMVVNNCEKIKVKGDIYTLKVVACNKIKIADQLRSIFSPLLYKRQVMKLVRDDIAFITNYLLNDGKFIEALSFNERYSNRGLTELLDSQIDKNPNSFEEQLKEINRLKNKINISIDASIDTKIKQSNGCREMIEGNTSIVLDTKTDENFLKLIFAYEDILKNTPSGENKNNYVNTYREQLIFIEGIEVNNIIKPLKERLKKIDEKENTVIIKFLVIDFKSYEKVTEEIKITPTTIWAFLIDRSGVRKEIRINSPSEFNCSEFISDIQKCMEKFSTQNSLADETLHTKMGELAKELKIYNEMADFTNIFIIPDGELSQIPLHLLDKFGQDLRKSKCVYYSPSLTYLLNTQVTVPLKSPKDDKYLWIRSPTKDLFTSKNGPCLEKPNIDPKNITLLECAGGTLEKFNELYGDGRYTHIGFSTHAAFHDNLVTAYVSLIKFYDSFLTTYDILLLMNFTNIEAIFLGACSGALTKYTDENESVGLVTAFLLKGANSVIAPICKISGSLHNELITQFNKNMVDYTSIDWNLDRFNIFRGLTEELWIHFVPFVQYSNLGIIENIHK